MRPFIFRVEQSKIAHITIEAESAEEAAKIIDDMPDEELIAKAFANGEEETGLYTDFANPEEDPENNTDEKDKG